MALKDQLASIASNVGAITRVPGAEGASDTYKTASGATAEPLGDGSGNFRVPILTGVDPDGTNGRGAYWAVVDASGKQVKEPYYQHTTNNDWSGLVAFAATALGASAFMQAGLGSELANSAAGWTADPAIWGTGAAGAGTAAASGGVLQAVAQATGLPVSTLATLGSTALTSLGRSLGILDANGNLSSNGLSNLAVLGSGLASLTGLRNASDTAATALNTAGNQVYDAYAQQGANMLGGYNALAGNIDARTQGIGQWAQDSRNALGAQGTAALTGLGQTGQDQYGHIGYLTKGMYDQLSGAAGNAYNNIADEAKASTGKFTPYSVTTNIGTTDSTGKTTLTPAQQAIVDNASKTASNSFLGANNINLDTLTADRLKKYALLNELTDSSQLAKLRANVQATGRTGLGSGEFGNGIFANPEEAAYWIGVKQRDAGQLLQAEQDALNERGAMINQGVASGGVPIQTAQQGLQQFQAGANAGSAAMQGNIGAASLVAGQRAAGAQAALGMAGKGVDSLSGMLGQGLQTNLDLTGQGIKYGLGQQGQGLTDRLGELDFGTRAAQTLGQQGLSAFDQNMNHGISARNSAYLNSIAQRYQGNLAVTRALVGMLQSLGGMTGSAAKAAQSGDVASLVSALQKAGMSNDAIQYMLTTNGYGTTGVSDATSMGNIADPYSWDSTSGWGGSNSLFDGVY